MDLKTSYNQVAKEYSQRIAGELAGKPLDRALLDCFAQAADGLVGDLGCGPGHVAAFLAERGAQVVGLDLSEGMVEQARRLHPHLDFRVGDLLGLPLEAASLSGAVAFYSLIHVEPAQIPAALAEIRRVLRPGGRLLVAFHIGDVPVQLTEWWGQAVRVEFHFFRPAQMEEWLAEAGFKVEYTLRRQPYGADVEHASERAYLCAQAV